MATYVRCYIYLCLYITRQVSVRGRVPGQGTGCACGGGVDPGGRRGTHKKGGPPLLRIPARDGDVLTYGPQQRRTHDRRVPRD